MHFKIAYKMDTEFFPAYTTYKIDIENVNLHWKVVEKTFPTGWAFQKVVDVPLEVFLFLLIVLLYL